MFTIRKLVLVAVTAALLAVVPFSPVRAATPLRSGTILGGTGWNTAIFWVRGMEGCVGVLTARGYGGGGYYIVQFWTPLNLGTEGNWCGEIHQGRLGSWECAPRYGFSPCPLHIPSNAKWVTITASPDHLKLNWKLW